MKPDTECTEVEVTPGVNLDEIWEALEGALRPFDDVQQRLSLEIYRHLAFGIPLSAEALARGLRVPVDQVEAELAREPVCSFTFRDDEGCILGYGGLATQTMAHHFEVDGRTLYTWCAWDALFIPELIGSEAGVASRCPVTDSPIELRVAPAGLGDVSPGTARMTFLLPRSAHFDGAPENVMASFCHHVFFVADEEAGRRWVAERPDRFLLSLDDAFRLGRKLNARNFGNALRARRAAADPASNVREEQSSGGPTSGPTFATPNT